jgi:RNA polymerase sigma-70 factor (ECF subfamily)
MRQYARGNVDALGTLVERHRRCLYGYILQMTEGKGDADEVFQGVWYRVIRKHKSYRAKNFRGWIMRIAHNLIIDRARRHKPGFSLDASEDGEQDMPVITAPGIGAGEALASRELGERIANAVRQLPFEQREVFLMRSQMDLPFKKIARIQHVSINTALARMHYAVDKLRTLLAQEHREWQTSGESSRQRTEQ